MERIIAAAILFRGEIITMPPPARHHTLLRHIRDNIIQMPHVEPRTQGFITDTGRFVERAEAMRIAVLAEQPIIREEALPICVGQHLFSEDLW